MRATAVAIGVALALIGASCSSLGPAGDNDDASAFARHFYDLLQSGDYVAAAELIRSADGSALPPDQQLAIRNSWSGALGVRLIKIDSVRVASQRNLATSDLERM